jgi:hypothetical protein
MGKSNAIVLFSRLTQLDRSVRDDFYSVMPWTDVDALFSTMFEDVADAALRFGKADVHVFRSAREQVDDFLAEFMKGVTVHDLEGQSFTSQISHALEHIAGHGYASVAVVLENNPLIDEAMFRTTFQQLSHEDDCAVVGLTDRERCYLIGLRQADYDLFDGHADDPALVAGGVLRLLCGLERAIVPVHGKYALDLAPNLGRLKSDLDELSLHQPALGRRSLQLFRNLERKYRRKNGK